MRSPFWSMRALRWRRSISSAAFSFSPSTPSSGSTLYLSPISPPPHRALQSSTKTIPQNNLRCYTNQIDEKVRFSSFPLPPFLSVLFRSTLKCFRPSTIFLPRWLPSFSVSLVVRPQVLTNYLSIYTKNVHHTIIWVLRVSPSFHWPSFHFFPSLSPFLSRLSQDTSR